MHRSCSLRRVFVPTFAVLLAAACDGNKAPTSPSQASPPGQTPQSIAITGNTAVEGPGQTSQLTAIVTFAAGATEDVTAKASWSGCEGVASIYRGLLTARHYGRCEVRVVYSSGGGAGIVRGSVHVDVVPESSFVLTGKAVESGFAVEGALVRMTSAAGEFTATTDVAGQFVLPARGESNVRAEKAGYAPGVRQFVAERDDQIEISLQRTDTPSSIAGVYTLTLTASPSCSNLPEQARRRVLAARVSEATPGKLLVELSGGIYGAFWGWGFTGTREANIATFKLSAYFDDDWTVLEQVKEVGTVGHEGTATATITERSIMGPLSGRVVIFGTNLRTETSSCKADDHLVELVR